MKATRRSLVSVLTFLRASRTKSARRSTIEVWRAAKVAELPNALISIALTYTGEDRDHLLLSFLM